MAGFAITSIGFVLGFVLELKGAIFVVMLGVLLGLIGTVLHFVQLYREARAKVISLYRKAQGRRSNAF
ncbi:type IV secretory pathway VirB3-like protein [Povalibacter uvarum]|uniref:Type IV secretory pathway VirB3-like protein n=1 Tax=Povalibacter uvarum TaxID=732238 RepID=A0A841HJ68_9GAMM|nr:type IV secretory pathway VirB3-like protein [Povalibacter uvarum]